MVDIVKAHGASKKQGAKGTDLKQDADGRQDAVFITPAIRDGTDFASKFNFV